MKPLCNGTGTSPSSSPHSVPSASWPCVALEHTAKTSAEHVRTVYSSFKRGNNRKTEKKNRLRDLNKQQIACAFHFHSRPSKTCFVRDWSYQPLECCLCKTFSSNSLSRGGSQGLGETALNGWNTARSSWGFPEPVSRAGVKWNARFQMFSSSFGKVYSLKADLGSARSVLMSCGFSCHVDSLSSCLLIPASVPLSDTSSLFLTYMSSSSIMSSSPPGFLLLWPS